MNMGVKAAFSAAAFTAAVGVLCSGLSSDPLDWVKIIGGAAGIGLAFMPELHKTVDPIVDAAKPLIEAITAAVRKKDTPPPPKP